jgi:HD-GYP domain-containing protein (c-di-GMP phosphodiesterase class II)
MTAVTVETGLPLPMTRFALAPKRLDRRWLARRAARLDARRQPTVSASARVSALVRDSGEPAAAPRGNHWRVISRLRPVETLAAPEVVEGPAQRSDQAVRRMAAARTKAAERTRAAERIVDTPAALSVEGLVSARSMTAEAVVAPERGVRTAELLGAFSRALDMAEGREPRHAMRTCYVAMRLADALHLSDAERLDLFYASLLKDAGTTSNAAATARLLGTSDIDQKRDLALVDPVQPLEYGRFVLDHLPEARVAENLGRFANVLRNRRANRHALVGARAERGAEIAHRLGLPIAVSEAIHAIDERWDGRGDPMGNRGHEIPLAARILDVAQGAAVFAERIGPRAAEKAMRTRRKGAYDPDLVDLLVGMGRLGLWRELLASNIDSRALALEPDRVVRISRSNDVDRIAAVFADVIDAKSPFTTRHSLHVGNLAGLVALQLGVEEPALTDIRRAGLLHDIGILAIPNTILDKTEPLSHAERLIVARHPQQALELLSRVPLFSAVAKLAACHHERLDGSGYPRGLRGEQLTLGARIVAAADIFETLTSPRPHHEAISASEALEVMEAAAGRHVAREAVAGLRAVV